MLSEQGAELPGEALDNLLQRSEGWAAGLRLWLLTAAEGERGLHGAQGMIRDYLLEEVIERQPPELQAFLYDTACLDRFSAELCDALRDSHDSAAILRHLQAHQVFLVPLDEHGHWFRYHHLFSDLLRARPPEAASQPASRLHLRACRWFSAQGLLDEAIDQALTFVGTLPRMRDMELVHEGDAPAPALANLESVTQILVNLLINAADATQRRGRVVLGVRSPSADRVAIEVRDNGSGIQPDVLERIFEPFFTTKGAGEGTGLGLSVSQTIVRRHRGTLIGENVPDWEGGGARFIVALPFLERRKIDRDLLEDDFEAEPAPGGEGRTALLIEDDHAVRLSMRRYLERFGWHVEEAGDGTAGALRVLAEPWDVVICDLRVPGKSGFEIYDQVEHTNWHEQGLPHEFTKLAPILRRWFLRSDAEDGTKGGGPRDDGHAQRSRRRGQHPRRDPRRQQLDRDPAAGHRRLGTDRPLAPPRPAAHAGCQRPRTHAYG